MRDYIAHPRNPRTIALATRRYRRFRPWLWPRLGGDRWLILWSPLTGADTDGGVIRILGHRRKTRADLELDQRLDMCCCHPDQPRGHR